MYEFLNSINLPIWLLILILQLLNLYQYHQLEKRLDRFEEQFTKHLYYHAGGKQ